MFFDAVARKEIDIQMESRVAQSVEDKKLTLFPPGMLFFLLYMLCICVGIVCTVFLYSLAFFPIFGVDEGLDRLLLPMGISIFLIVIVIAGLLSLISGVANVYSYLGVFAVFILFMALFFCIFYLFDLNLSIKPMHAIAVLTLAISIVLLSNKKFYSFVSYFRAKKMLRELITAREKSSRNSK